jgi:ParB family chromosome partitioning protein
MFEILPKCSEKVRGELAAILLSRPEPPVAEARTVLDSPDPTTAGVAARVLGRAGSRAAAEAGPAVAKALVKWRTTWEEQRPDFVRTGTGQRAAERRKLAVSLTSCVRDLVWAAGRLGVAQNVLVEAAGARPDDPEYQPIRLAAVLALGSDTIEVFPGAVSALESAALLGDPEVRASAAQALARRDPNRAAALSDRLLSDRVGFHRLELDHTIAIDETLRSAARQVHYQGVVLLDLIDRGEVATLAAVAEDRSLPEAARLGAIEGLAAMAREPAEEALRRVGVPADEDEEIRKAAWRGLRRSKRARRQAPARKAEVSS